MNAVIHLCYPLQFYFLLRPLRCLFRLFHFLKKILSPFYSTKLDGMGIGLSISRLIIEAHDGVFHFNSKSKKGSTFYFTLPVKGKLSDG